MMNTLWANIQIRPRFTSLVASARNDSTATMISTIMSVIAVVGGSAVYVSSRLKKYSTRLKSSMSLARPALTSLAA